jgi:hypothetical protein
VLQKHDLRAAGEEVVIALTVMPPGAREGRHTHPAQAFVYVLEGKLVMNELAVAISMAPVEGSLPTGMTWWSSQIRTGRCRSPRVR